MKSITKRRLKTRSIGRNTINRQHKRRHSNRRWGAGQNKSRKKRMIGGSVGYKGGGGLTRLFNNSGWKCDCTTTHQDSPASSRSAPDTVVKPPTGQPQRPHPTARSSIAAVTAPVGQSKYSRRARIPTDIIDATSSRKFLVDSDYALVQIHGDPTILINTKRHADALPEYLKNGQFITKVGDLPVGPLNKIGDFYKLLESNDFYDKPVVLTVARGAAGGTGDRQFKVQVILKRDMPMQGTVGGGEKTTYRRKKHVTRRKINTKRMKVMVGGYVLLKNVTCRCSKNIKGNDPRADESVSKGKGEGEGEGEGDDVSVSESKGVSKGVSEGVSVSVSEDEVKGMEM